MALEKLDKNHSNKIVVPEGIADLVSCGPPILIYTQSRDYSEKYSGEYDKLLHKAIEEEGRELRAHAYEKGEHSAPTMSGSHWHFNLTGSMPYEVFAVQYYRIKKSRGRK